MPSRLDPTKSKVNYDGDIDWLWQAVGHTHLSGCNKTAVVCVNSWSPASSSRRVGHRLATVVDSMRESIYTPFVVTSCAVDPVEVSLCFEYWLVHLP